MPTCQSFNLGMYLAQYSVTSAVSLTTTSPVSLHETSSTVHPIGDCFLVSTLRDSWSWRDLFIGDPLFVSVDQREQSVRRISAQHTRNPDRATRGVPPTWEGVTMSFAANVLELPQGSRSHYKKLQSQVLQ